MHCSDSSELQAERDEAVRREHDLSAVRARELEEQHETALRTVRAKCAAEYETERNTLCAAHRQEKMRLKKHSVFATLIHSFELN